jgi:hypothetical protein
MMTAHKISEELLDLTKRYSLVDNVFNTVVKLERNGLQLSPD